MERIVTVTVRVKDKFLIRSMVIVNGSVSADALSVPAQFAVYAACMRRMIGMVNVFFS